ncbi:MAG: FtsX-like permease family protein [Cytophagales bacterium]|nr:MAG: FtsX-like permease family protein [Cytophagales bacterium]
MIRHLFTLIWNKKRTHALLLIEILASFLVLFGVTSLIIYNFRNYAEPVGFNYQNRWAISMDWGDMPDSVSYPLRQQLKQRVLAYPQVIAASISSGNYPFSNSTSNGRPRYNGVQFNVFNYFVDPDYAKTLEMAVLEGRWYDRADESTVVPQVVVTRDLIDKVFGKGQPGVGKLLINDEDKKDKKRIIGVVGNFKQDGEFSPTTSCIFYRASKTDWSNVLLVQVQPGTDAAFEGNMMRELGQMVKGWNLEVSYLADQRVSKQRFTLVPMIIFLVVSTFLLINVALGLFGVLNVSITRRRGEIGLRRALGATEGSISRQFVGEIWVLATFALVLGLILAAQFPLMNVFDLDASVYLTAMVVSVLVIYLIVTLCALYPSRQAATIQPATALHEE